MTQPLLSDLLSFLGSSVERWGDGDLFKVMWGGELRGMAGVVGEPSDDTLPRIAADGIRYLGATQESFDAYQAHLARRYIAKVRGGGDACANIPGAEERLREQIVLLGRRVRNDLAAGALICDLGESPIALLVGSLAPLVPDLPKPTTKTLQRVDRAARRLAAREGDESVIDDQFVAPAKLDDAAGAHEAFAVVLGDIGEKGKEAAKDIRAHAASLAQETSQLKRWAWLLPANGETARCHAALVRVAWLDVVRPQLERAVYLHPSVAKPVHSNISLVMSSVPKRVETANGAELVRGNVRVSEFRPTEHIAASAVEEYVERIRSGVSKLGSIVSHRLIRYLVSTAHTRHADGDPDPRTIIFTGGFAAVADAIGCRSKADAEVVRDVLAAFDACRIFPRGTVNGGSFRLMTVDETPAKRGQQGTVTVTLTQALLPHFGNRHLTPGEARHLVPLLPVPPLVGRGQDHGAIATMGLETTALLRNRADELASEGHVGIDERDWRDLAERSSLPRARLSRVLERWLRDDSDGPAFLSSPAEGRFRLAPDYEAAHLFLVEGGNRTLAGRAAGQRSAQKRRSELKRHGGR